VSRGGGRKDHTDESVSSSSSKTRNRLPSSKGMQPAKRVRVDVVVPKIIGLPHWAGDAGAPGHEALLADDLPGEPLSQLAPSSTGDCPHCAYVPVTSSRAADWAGLKQNQPPGIVWRTPDRGLPVAKKYWPSSLA
jgi:hypothetical protein